jgi:Ca2+-binding EF-hand superfamily protein
MQYMKVRGLGAWHDHVVQYLNVTTPAQLRKLDEASLNEMAAAAEMQLDSALIARVLKAIRLTDHEVAAATLAPSEPGSARSTVASEDGWAVDSNHMHGYPVWPDGVDFARIDSMICKVFDRFGDEKAAREAFSRLDRARSKRLGANELRNGLRDEYHMREFRTDDGMSTYLVMALDGDGDGHLCAQDFAYGQKLARLGFVRQKLRAFAAAKYSGDMTVYFESVCGSRAGSLNFSRFRQEVRTRAKIPPAQMSDPELKEIFSFVDADGNGGIDCGEFSAIMSDGGLSKFPRENVRAAVVSSFRPSAGSVAPKKRRDKEEPKQLAGARTGSPTKWEDSLQRPGPTAFSKKASLNGSGQAQSSPGPARTLTPQEREAGREAERLSRLYSGAVVSMRFMQASAHLEVTKAAGGKTEIVAERQRRKGDKSTQNVVVRLARLAEGGGTSDGDDGSDAAELRSGDQVVVHFVSPNKYLTVDEQQLELNGLATRPPPLSAPLTISLWDDASAFGSGSGSDADGNGSARPRLHFGDAVTLRSCNGAHFECAVRNQVAQVGARRGELPESPRGLPASSPFVMTLENRDPSIKAAVQRRQQQQQQQQRRAASPRVAPAPAAVQLADEEADGDGDDTWDET